MIVCAKCRRQMRPEKNGVAILFQHRHAYIGDLFQCAACGHQVVHTNSRPTTLSPPDYEAMAKAGKLVRMPGADES